MPFCPSICPFCDFHVMERRSAMVDDYLVELDREAASLADRGDIGPFRSVYLGGGTPSHLRMDELERVLDIVRTRFGESGGQASGRLADEVTLEVHPSTVGERRPQQWVDLGVTRLSVGVQSFSDETLIWLGRPHDASACYRAVEACQATGAMVSIDLITAVPGQDLEREFDAVVALGADHVSAYTLTIEPGTPFHRAGVVVDEEAARHALVCSADRLAAAGLERYEVSNYARPGARSLHNQAYWTNRCFVGIGPSAASHLPARAEESGRWLTERHSNPSWDAWLRGERGEPEYRDAHELLIDGLLCGLRLRDGVDLDRLRDQTGREATVERAGPIATLRGRGLLDLAIDDLGARRLRATDAGVLVLDAVIAELL